MPEAAAAPTFWIREGVRRAKAFALEGHATVECEVFRSDSTTVGTIEIPIEQLLSPKKFIDVSNRRLRERFDRIRRAVAQGRRIDPIAVEPGSRGYPLADVEFDEKGLL